LHSECGPYISGAYDQQLQRGVFILKEETDKEQTSYIDRPMQ